MRTEESERIGTELGAFEKVRDAIAGWCGIGCILDGLVVI